MPCEWFFWVKNKAGIVVGGISIFHQLKTKPKMQFR